MARDSAHGQDVPQPPATMKLGEFLAGELPALVDVVSFCNNLPMSLYVDSTVVKSPEVVYRGVNTSRTTLVAEDYLLNFRRSDSDIGVLIGTNGYRLPGTVRALALRDLEADDAEVVALPPPLNERAPIGPVIRSRRTRRKYSGEAAALAEVSTILAHAAGLTGHLDLDLEPPLETFPESRLDLRATVSGGALYPVDLYVVALNVAGLPPGAYRYLPGRHALAPTAASRPLPELRPLASFSEIEVEKAAFLVAYVYNLFENSRKYGESGLAFAFIEAGGMAAHVHLSCTALGLGSCDVGGFSKSRFEPLLDADGLSRHMIHLTVVGK